MTTINLTKHPAAQDMVQIVMDTKGLSASEAVAYSVNRNIYDRIVATGWASIALDLWGHGDPDREWKKLADPRIKIEFDEESQTLINEIMKKEDVKLETAVSFFLIFTMDSLGYHI